MAKAQKTRTRRSSADADDVTLQVLDLFFRQGLNAATIADRLTARGIALKRPQVYHYLQRGRDRGLIKLVPRTDAVLRDELEVRFRLKEQKVEVDVVQVPGGTQTPAECIAERVAAVVIEKLKAVQELDSSQPAGLGLGSGRFSLHLMKALDRQLTAERPFGQKKIRLIACTALAPIKAPQLCPVSFFNLLHDEFIEEQIGLFTEPMMDSGSFRSMIDPNSAHASMGWRHAAPYKNLVDVVVTGLGDPKDTSDLYRHFLRESGYFDRDERASAKTSPPRVAAASDHASGGSAASACSAEVDRRINRWLDERGICGNFQYRPYTMSSHYEEADDEPRAVTMFDLREFSRMAHDKRRHVILAVRPNERGQTRHEALWPLMFEARGEVRRPFSHLVIDTDTVRELLAYDAKVRRLAETPAVVIEESHGLGPSRSAP